MGLLYNHLNKANQYKELGMAHLFRVQISGLYNASFTNVSGLSADLSMFEYREGGENSYVHHLPDHSQFGDVTLQKGVIRNDSDLWYWFRSYYQLEGTTNVPILSMRPRFFRDVTITVLSNNGISLVIYRLYRAWVKSITPGTLDAHQSAYHGVSVTLGHHGLDAEFPIRTARFANNQAALNRDAAINEGVL